MIRRTELVLTQAQIRSFLASVQPFKALARGELDKTAGTATAHGYSDGETVYREGERAKSVWIVYQGRVVVFKESPVQGRFPIETLGPGELFGTLCRLGGDSEAYPCTGTAAGRTIVLRLPDRSFFAAYEADANFARKACSICSLRLAVALDLRNVDQAPVRVRIAQTLTRLHRVYGATIPLTKRELAELVGTALETAFRELAKLQRAGILRSERGRIIIKKAPQLQAPGAGALE